MIKAGQPAPPWSTTQWFNSPQPLQLADLRGRVVILHTFQMLCPGCVFQALPQTQKLHQLFSGEDAIVVGLHTVFEHHEAMTPTALAAFIHEFRLGFPIGVDEPGNGGPLPKTMAAYGLRGTPSLLLIDREGVVRYHNFGQEDDMELGATVARLIAR
ncbi:MAG: redoxin domain-containing protein [Alphaproteobacteria bacterium]|nr:redoxin domain-containing protein [Alphaproteobacteria bacterium]